MYILGINTSHHASVCLLKDGEIVFFLEEERLSHVKYSYEIKELVNEVLKHTNKIDVLCYSLDSGSGVPYNKVELYNKKTVENFNKVKVVLGSVYEKMIPLFRDSFYFSKLFNLENMTELLEIGKTTIMVNINSHHLSHARHSFYNSGYEEAVCVVVDGMGSRVSKQNNYNIHEVESVYKLDYINQPKEIYKRYKDFSDDSVFGIGNTYTNVTRSIGFNEHEDGKTMGLSSYYKHETEFSKESNLDYKKAGLVQSWSENKVLDLINTAIDISKCKNVCLSGGYGLNCVANYKFRKSLPADVNLYVDPLCYDAGHAMGLAKYYWYETTKDTKARPLSSLYLGSPPEY